MDSFFAQAAMKDRKPDQKAGVYNVFSNMNTASNDIYNNLQNVQQDYTNNPQKVYSNIMNSYNEKFGTTYDRNTATSTSYNQLAANGIDPNSYMGQYEQQTISNRIGEDAKQNYFNQVLGIQNSGIGLGQNLLSQGIGAGQSLVQGVQGDTQLKIAQQEADTNRMRAENEAKKNSIGSNMLSTVAGYAGKGLGAAFGGPVGAAIGGSLAKGIVGAIGK